MCSLPFALFMLPVLSVFLHNAMPTAYDRYGRRSPYQDPSALTLTSTLVIALALTLNLTATAGAALTSTPVVRVTLTLTRCCPYQYPSAKMDGAREAETRAEAKAEEASGVSTSRADAAAMALESRRAMV